MEFTIRKARSVDAADLADLLRSIHYFSRIEAEPAGTTIDRVSRELELSLVDNSHTIYVAESAGAIAAYAAVHWLPYLFLDGPEGYVSELFVRESARGRGMGAKLLDALKEEARARGCARLSLINMRFRESYQRGFYSKQGWEERPDAANFVLNLED